MAVNVFPTKNSLAVMRHIDFETGNFGTPQKNPGARMIHSR